MIENSQYLPVAVWAQGQAYKGTKKMESLLGNLMLSYKKEWRKHFFDVLGLAEVQKDQYSGFYTTVTNFSIDGLGYNNLQGGALRPWEGTNSYYEDPRLASFMGRVNYTYDDRYILTVNARGDASSKFGLFPFGCFVQLLIVCFDGFNLHFIQSAGSFFAVATDEGNGSSVFQ